MPETAVVPTNVIAVPDGGSILIMWDEDPLVAYYDVYASIDGSEFNIVKNAVAGTNTTLNGLPFDTVIKIKVGGQLFTGEYMDVVDAKLGRRFSDTVNVRVTAIDGSTVAKGTTVVLRNVESGGFTDVLIGFPNDVNI